MFERILLPLDGSQLAECVFPHLATLAQVYSPELLVLRVLEPERASACDDRIDPVNWQMCRAEAESYLTDVTARLAEAGLQASVRLAEGKAGEQIVEAAQAWRADLIMMSSHGRSGLSRWNLSSTVQRVFLGANRSLMLIPAYKPAGFEPVGLQYRRIFLPLDGSQRAEMPLALAESIARGFNSEILVSLVVRKPEILRQIAASSEDAWLVDRLSERNLEEGRAYLEDLRCRLDLDIRTHLAISANVSVELHRIAAESEVDLTILSAHGQSADTRWPFGSVALGFIVYGATPLMVLQDLPAERIDPSEAEKASRKTQAR